MHKAIVWNKKKTRKYTITFEHYRKYNDINIFKLGTTDTETYYIPENRLVHIIWDNSIIQRKGK